MSESRTVPIMLFVLGLAFIIIGIALSLVRQVETRTQNYYGFPIPTQVTVQPYVGVGIFMAIVGVVIVIGALVKAASRQKTVYKYSRTQLASTPPQSYYSEPPTATTNEPTIITCEHCGGSMSIAAHFCPNCGAKRGTPTS